MLKLLELFWLIARRKLGPEDIPISTMLLQITVVIYAVLQVPLLWRQGGISAATGLSIVADAVIISAFVWVLLRITGNLSRYLQTLTAFFGTGSIVTSMSACRKVASF
jgi:hypothetical protein